MHTPIIKSIIRAAKIIANARITKTLLLKRAIQGVPIRNKIAIMKNISRRSQMKFLMLSFISLSSFYFKKAALYRSLKLNSPKKYNTMQTKQAIVKSTNKKCKSQSV